MHKYRNNCVHCEHLHSTSFIQTSLIRKFSTKSAVVWISATKKKADKEWVWTVGGWEGAPGQDYTGNVDMNTCTGKTWQVHVL